jgi:hypothetical protein
MSAVDVIRAVSLGEFPHGFLGRRGGVSSGELAGLNVGYGSNDERSAIDENRRRAIAALLPDAELATVHQVHSAEVVHANAPWAQDARPRADAMVTDRPNLLLGILTADCAPVLFADHRAVVVGAAHAGWRGALAGVTDSTIAAMERLGSEPRYLSRPGPLLQLPPLDPPRRGRLRASAQRDRHPRLTPSRCINTEHLGIRCRGARRLASIGRPKRQGLRQ